MAITFNTTALNIANNTFDLASDTFYLELVTAAPAASVTTNASLTKASGGNYAPVVLTNASATRVSAYGTGGTKLDFDDAAWSGLYTTAATPIVGGVVCKRVGGSPATSDPVVAYSALNTSYVPATGAGTATDFTFVFGANGVLTIGS